MAVSQDVRLAIYNGALQRLGSRELASLAENREPRRVLDGHWGSDNAVVKRALEKGEWNFSIRTVEGIYSPGIEPAFGFARAYGKPDDMLRLAAIASDEYFRSPLVASQYTDEAGFWFTDQPVIYARYVSMDDSYGMDSSKWTEAFKEYLQCDLAWLACERLTNATSKRDRIERDRMNALKAAKSLDTMGDGAKFLPHGSWARSRAGGFGSRRDG